MSLALHMPIFKNFQLNEALGETLKQKLSLIATIKAPFYWKLFKIGMPSAKDIRKGVLILRVRPCHAHTA